MSGRQPFLKDGTYGDDGAIQAYMGFSILTTMVAIAALVIGIVSLVRVNAVQAQLDTLQQLVADNMLSHAPTLAPGVTASPSAAPSAAPTPSP